MRIAAVLGGREVTLIEGDKGDVARPLYVAILIEQPVDHFPAAAAQSTFTCSGQWNPDQRTHAPIACRQPPRHVVDGRPHPADHTLRRHAPVHGNEPAHQPAVVIIEPDDASVADLAGESQPAGISRRRPGRQDA